MLKGREEAEMFSRACTYGFYKLRRRRAWGAGTRKTKLDDKSYAVGSRTHRTRVQRAARCIEFSAAAIPGSMRQKVRERDALRLLTSAAHTVRCTRLFRFVSFRARHPRCNVRSHSVFCARPGQLHI